MAAPSINQAVVVKADYQAGTTNYLKSNGSGGWVYDTVSANANLFANMAVACQVAAAVGGIAVPALILQNWTAR